VDQGNYVTPTDSNGIVASRSCSRHGGLHVPEDNVAQIVKRLHTNAKLPATHTIAAETRNSQPAVS